MDYGRDTQAAGQFFHDFTSLEVTLGVDLGEWDAASAHVVHCGSTERAAWLCVYACLGRQC